MKNETKIFINEKGIFVGVLSIVMVSWVFGFVLGVNSKGNKTVFTKDDIAKIVQIQDMENRSETGLNVTAFKDKNGDLIIGFTSEE